MMRVAHLTSAHQRNDTRIFVKECISLAEQGLDVHLIVADGAGDERRNRVHVHDVGASSGRFDRMRHTSERVFHQALTLDADIYHLHDPELLPSAVKLKRRGKTVIFDAHEDLPKQLLGKPYLSPIVRQVLSRAFATYEWWSCRKLDGIVAATPSIGEKFRLINPRTLNVNNYPLLDELQSTLPWTDKLPEVCYIGSISVLRGIVDVCGAMGMVRSGVRLNLAGTFSEAEVEQKVKTMAGWERVNQLGHLDREAVRGILERSVAGLVTFHPMPNHVDAQPNKMFEYMSAGIPVIASDFPLWRDIILDNDCGLLVDPRSPAQIAQAIDTLVSDPALAKRLGENGRKAVEKRYNWNSEQEKLFAFYRTVHLRSIVVP